MEKTIKTQTSHSTPFQIITNLQSHKLAQMRQKREVDKKRSFCSLLLLASGPPPPNVEQWESEILGQYSMLCWMPEVLKQILHLN